MEIKAFSLVGDPQDSVLVVIGGKLVRADYLVQPKVTVEVKGKPTSGEMVMLSVKVTDHVPSQVKGETCKWEVTQDGRPKDFFCDGKCCFFAAGVKPTTYHVSALVGLTYELDGKPVLKPVLGTVDVRIGDVGPDPGPRPNLKGIAKLVHDWAVDPQVLPSAGRAGCRALSTAFKKTSQRIGKDLLDLRSALVESKKANNDALKAARVDPTLFDPWGMKLQESLYSAYTAGEFKDVKKLAKYYWEIAAGLYQVKG